MDTALDPERVDVIRKEILCVGGVRELHMLRTRMMGGEALVDVHVIVDPKLSVSEGHYIGEKVRKRLIEEVEEVTDVMVHVDPEDDEKMKPSLGLPTRSWVRSQLEDRWADLPMAKKIERIMLHYLDGKLDVEVCFPAEARPADDAGKEQLTAMRQAAEELEQIREFTVYYRGALK